MDSVMPPTNDDKPLIRQHVIDGKELPSEERYRKYRQRQRTTVRAWVACYRAGLAAINQRERDIVQRRRRNHSDSIARQLYVTGLD